MKIMEMRSFIAIGFSGGSILYSPGSRLVLLRRVTSDAIRQLGDRRLR